MAPPQYVDFDVLIEATGDGRYRARVVESPVGDAVREFDVPFSSLELENFFLRLGQSSRSVRRAASPQAEAVRRFGTALYEAAFGGDIDVCLRRSIDEADRNEQGLRIRLRLGDRPELHDLPWEFLHSPGLGRPLALSEQTPLVRYVDLATRIKPLKVAPPLRVLLVVSSPTDHDPLDVEAEQQKLSTSLERLVAAGRVELEATTDASLRSLRSRLRTRGFHVLHFIGHGLYDPELEEGVLIFEDEERRGRKVGGGTLGTLLHDHRSLRLVILNACEGARPAHDDPFGGVAQNLVRQGIPAVIAMQFAITDTAAITFADEFYAAIADGYPVDAATASARKAILSADNAYEWGTPVLYLRAPDGVVFDVDTEKAPPPPPRESPRQLYADAMEALGAGRLREAEQGLARVVVLDPGFEDAGAKLEEIRVDLQVMDLYGEAERLVAEEDWERAQELLEAAEALAPGRLPDPAGLRAKVEARRRLSEVERALAEERFEDALTSLDLLRRRPGMSGLGEQLLERARRGAERVRLVAEARRALDSERGAEALTILERAADLDPTWADPEHLRARAAAMVEEEERRADLESRLGGAARLLAAGEVEEADRMLDEVASEEPLFPGLAELRARADAQRAPAAEAPTGPREPSPEPARPIPAPASTLPAPRRRRTGLVVAALIGIPLLLLFVVLALVCAASPACSGPPDPVVTVPQADALPPADAVAVRMAAPPTVDAQPLEWQAAPQGQSPFVVHPPGFTDSTVSARWSVGWDDSALYLFVEVVDPVVVQPWAGQPDQLWQGDSVHFEFGLDPSGLGGSAGLRPGDVHVLLGPIDQPGQFQAIAAVNPARDGVFVTGGVEPAIEAVSALTVAPGYSIEARVPWEVLGVSGPARGDVFGMNVNVSDGDFGGLIVMMSSNPDRTGANQPRPGTWNTVVLGP